MKYKFRVILLVVLFVVGILAFMGAFMLYDIKSTGVYEADSIRRDLLQSILCTCISLAYPVYYVIRNRKKISV